MKKLMLSLLVLASANIVMAQMARGIDKAPGSKKEAASARAAENTGPKSLAIGSTIPNEGALLQDFDGKPTTLGENKTAKGLLVMFSCNTCPFVIKGQPLTKAAMSMSKKLGIGM